MNVCRDCDLLQLVFGAGQKSEDDFLRSAASGCSLLMLLHAHCNKNGHCAGSYNI
jgi:hypothetical protein